MGSKPGGPPSGGGPGYWPAVALIAVIIATAGWTTVGVLVLNPRTAAVASEPIATDEALGDESFPPEEEVSESHTFPDLEALLPAVVDGAPLAIQSFTGADVFPEEGWGTSVRGFLTSIGKTPEDVQAAVAEDPQGALALDFLWAYRLADVEPKTLRDAIIAGWRVDYPELKVTTATVAGKAVTRVAYFEDVVGSTLYIHDGTLFDIESEDEALSTTILAALPPASSPAPSASGSAASAPASASPAP
ncbi:MAG: hypothetical protein ACXWW6_03400 [Candidatus Limnocylindrales bacterium]